MKIQPTSHRTLHVWLRALVLLVIGFTISETFLVLGVVTPVAIEGSSMAPTALGPHLEIECPNCQHQFAVGTDQLPPRGDYVCPDCQQLFIVSGDLPVKAGRRVWVDRTSLATSKIGRWDVVVFRCPSRATNYCIKRVLGLPGEHVDFYRGDLIVDGRVVRKNYEQQLRLRQLVHAERPALLAWHSTGVQWQFDQSTWRHTGATSELEFRPPGKQLVTNESGANQAAAPRRSVALDLMFSCDLELAPDASIEAVATFEDGTQLISPAVEYPARRLIWSLFDRQAVLIVDGKQLYRREHNGRWPGPPRLSLRATGDVVVDQLTVWRDVYLHTRSIDLWPNDGVTLGPNSLFVVGDNVDISSDSRNWPGHALPMELLIGRPMGIE